MNNNILLAILAGLIAVSQTMDYHDQVQQDNIAIIHSH